MRVVRRGAAYDYAVRAESAAAAEVAAQHAGQDQRRAAQDVQDHRRDRERRGRRQHGVRRGRRGRQTGQSASHAITEDARTARVETSFYKVR